MKTQYDVNRLIGENRKLPIVKYEVETRVWPVGDCRAL